MGVEHLPLGTPFGRYVVQRLLGSGTFGAVYAATHQDLHRKVVALKVLHRHLLHLDEVVRRFQNEARLIAELRHPHIVDVVDVGHHDGVPFMAMEFLEGETLADRIEREGRLSVRHAVDVLLPLCSAVAAVHASGIVHRDLKPENIVLAVPRPGRIQPKLLDFGVAKERIGQAGMTRTGATMGTPFYMSPEQVEEARDSDGASDQWGLAVILYHCVTGTLPFQGRSTVAVLHKIVTEAPMPPSVVQPACPPELDAVVLRAMEKSPRDRFPDVRAFAAALLPFASPRAQDEWSEEFAGGSLAAHTVIDAMATEGPDTPTRVVAQPTPVELATTPDAPPTVLSTPPPAPSWPPPTTAPASLLERHPPFAQSTMSLSVRELPTPYPSHPPPERVSHRGRWLLALATVFTLCLSTAALWSVMSRPSRAQPAQLVAAQTPTVAAPTPVTHIAAAAPEAPPPEPAREAPPTPVAPPSEVASAPSTRPRPGVRPLSRPARGPSRPPPMFAGPRIPWIPPGAPTPPPPSAPPPSSQTNSGLRVRY